MDDTKRIDEEVKGAESAVKKMLLYYASSLQSSGVEDIKQYIATKLIDIIPFTKDQLDFIQTNLNSDNKIIENLKMSISLLKNIEKTNQLDIDSVKIVRQVLELTLNDYNEVINNQEDKL